MDEIKYVTFYNGKSHQRLGRIPWKQQSYLNPKSKRRVDFSKLPLCEEELDEEGNPIKMKFDGKQVFWGECLDFLANPSKQLVLHPITHHFVIQAIRDWSDCVSTKKSEGMPGRTNGRLIEYEPEVLSAKRREEVNTKLAVMKAITALNNQNDLTLLRQIGVLLNLNSKDLRDDLWRSLMVTSELDGKGFLEVIEYDEEGKVVLANDSKNKAIVLMAVQWGAISNNGGHYFVDGVDLGTKLDKIHVDHATRLALIQQALEDKHLGG